MTDYRLNAYHIMWIFIMFDLPTVTKKDKKVAARFSQGSGTRWLYYASI